MLKHYNKLVRDRVPEIIQAAGQQYAVEVMSDQEYNLALRKKLVEEAQEAAATNPENLIGELADLYEVMDTLMAAHRIDPEAVLAEQERKRIERGGFSCRIRLLWSGQTRD